MRGLYIALAFSLASYAVSMPIEEDAEAFADDTPLDEIPPEEAGGKFEGDIDEDPAEFEGKHRNALTSSSKRWPNGVVPYVISSSYTSSEKSIITGAMREMESKTSNCVRFVPRTSEANYVSIKSISGCFSGVGRRGRGSQDLSLTRGCLRRGTIMHELIHALGFHHEQSRADRDDYVTIQWSNIKSGKENNFKKYELGYIQHLTSYDYGSLMHYSAYGFAKDRSKPTITPKNSGARIGQRTALSTKDIEEIKKFYQCGGSGTGGTNNVVTTSKPVTQKPVTQKPSGSTLASCSFDSGLCGWTQSTSDDFDWTRRSGSTPTSNTGPSSGYGNKGSYLYVEASNHFGKTAKLVSPRLPHAGGSQVYCINFNYHMHGSKMGDLGIGVKLGSSYRPLYVLKGSKSSSWRTMRLSTTISYSGSALNFYFDGKIGSGAMSDMAIDNVKISTGKC